MKRHGSSQNTLITEQSCENTSAISELLKTDDIDKTKICDFSKCLNNKFVTEREQTEDCLLQEYVKCLKHTISHKIE